ncbi:hypothetical protein Tco_0345107 [Tanacetum coccineum]
MMATMKHMTSDLSKLGRFKGMDFRRWQKNMHFFLTNMSVVYAPSTPILDNGDDTTMEQMRKGSKWENDDYVAQEIDKPKSNNIVGSSVVNMVEHNNSTRYNDNKGKRKHHDNTKADPSKKSKLKWVAGENQQSHLYYRS